MEFKNIISIDIEEKSGQRPDLYALADDGDVKIIYGKYINAVYIGDLSILKENLAIPIIQSLIEAEIYKAGFKFEWDAIMENNEYETQREAVVEYSKKLYNHFNR